MSRRHHVLMTHVALTELRQMVKRSRPPIINLVYMRNIVIINTLSRRGGTRTPRVKRVMRLRGGRGTPWKTQPRKHKTPTPNTPRPSKTIPTVSPFTAPTVSRTGLEKKADNEGDMLSDSASVELLCTHEHGADAIDHTSYEGAADNNEAPGLSTRKPGAVDSTVTGTSLTFDISPDPRKTCVGKSHLTHHEERNDLAETLWHPAHYNLPAELAAPNSIDLTIVYCYAKLICHEYCALEPETKILSRNVAADENSDTVPATKTLDTPVRIADPPGP